jgi:hypothetical protein
MNELTFENLRKSCLIVAKYSFIIGSVIFFSFILTRISELQILGFIFNIVACTINGILLLILLSLIAIYPRHYWNILHLILILLFNVPLAIFYLFIATQF